MFWFPCNSLSCNTRQKERASVYIACTYHNPNMEISCPLRCSLLRPCVMVVVHYSTGYIKCLSKHGSNTTMIIRLCFKILSPFKTSISQTSTYTIDSSINCLKDRIPLVENRFANNICSHCASSR